MTEPTTTTKPNNPSQWRGLACFAGAFIVTLAAYAGWSAHRVDDTTKVDTTQATTETTFESKPSRLMPMDDLDELVDDALADLSRPEADPGSCDNTPLTVAAPAPSGWSHVARTIDGVTVEVPLPPEWTVVDEPMGVAVVAPGETAFIEVTVLVARDAPWDEVGPALADEYAVGGLYARLVDATPVVQSDLPGCSFGFDIEDGQMDTAVLDGDAFTLVVSSAAVTGASTQQDAQWGAFGVTAHRES